MEVQENGKSSIVPIRRLCGVLGGGRGGGLGGEGLLGSEIGST